uniref:Ribonuclease T(2) n=1 Tax=Steinernema glaseri TaxID=37863 RepID=A0A1I7Z1C7_9BILA
MVLVFWKRLLALFFLFSSCVADFDYYVLTRQYPMAICRADNQAHSDSCKIPSDTDSWTLHGLWPSSSSRRDIEFCTKDKFDDADIKPIWKKLLEAWPNLLTGKGVTSFWKHEFEKHGTCALSEVKNELGYFKTSIQLHERFNITKALEDGGIKQSEDTRYALADIRAVAEYRLGKRQLQLHCVHDKDNDWLLADIRLCLNKSFNPVDCPRLRKHNPAKYFNKLKQGGALPPVEPCPAQGIKYIGSEVSGPKSSPLASFMLSAVVLLATILFFRVD